MTFRYDKKKKKKISLGKINRQGSKYKRGKYQDLFPCKIMLIYHNLMNIFLYRTMYMNNSNMNYSINHKIN